MGERTSPVDRGHVDVAAVLATTLDAAVSHPVYTSLDAGVGAGALPVSVVTAPVVAPQGRFARMLWRAQVTLVTIAQTPAEAMAAHREAATALLGTSFGQGYRFSRLACTMEPDHMPPREEDWPGVRSTYQLYIWEA